METRRSEKPTQKNLVTVSQKKGVVKYSVNLRKFIVVMCGVGLLGCYFNLAVGCLGYFDCRSVFPSVYLLADFKRHDRIGLVLDTYFSLVLLLLHIGTYWNLKKLSGLVLGSLSAILLVLSGFLSGLGNQKTSLKVIFWVCNAAWVGIYYFAYKKSISRLNSQKLAWFSAFKSLILTICVVGLLNLSQLVSENLFAVFEWTILTLLIVTIGVLAQLLKVYTLKIQLQRDYSLELTDI